MPIQLFFKERFPLFPLQLKMTSVEDFQFSHQGVPPSWSSRSGESTPSFFSLWKENLHKRSYATDEVILTDPIYVGLLNRVRLASGVPRLIPLIPGGPGG